MSFEVQLPSHRILADDGQALIADGESPGGIKFASFSATLASGFVTMFAGSSPPVGWLVCDGSLVPRATYASLFAAIGTTWGSGDGSTTFALPDMRDVFPMGVSPTNTLGSAGGSREATLIAANLPPHTHTIAHNHNIARSAGPNTGGGTRVSLGDTSTAGDGTTDASNTPNSGNGPGSSQPVNILNPYRTINFIIKT